MAFTTFNYPQRYQLYCENGHKKLEKSFLEKIKLLLTLFTLKQMMVYHPYTPSIVKNTFS